MANLKSCAWSVFSDQQSWSVLEAVGWLWMNFWLRMIHAEVIFLLISNQKWILFKIKVIREFQVFLISRFYLDDVFVVHLARVRLSKRFGLGAWVWISVSYLFRRFLEVAISWMKVLDDLDFNSKIHWKKPTYEITTTRNITIQIIPARLCEFRKNYLPLTNKM